MFSKKLHAQYRVVAYDPSKPPKDGPVVIEVWKEAEHGDENSTEHGTKLKEFRLSPKEIEDLYFMKANTGLQEHRFEAFLKKHKLLSPQGKLTGGGDGDRYGLYWESDEGGGGFFFRVKEGFEEALDSALSEVDKALDIEFGD